MASGQDLRLVDDHLRSSEALKAIGRICPKCRRARTAADTAPPWQCPACLIAYNKLVPKTSPRRDRSPAGVVSAADRPVEPRSGLKRAWVAAMGIVALAVVAWTWVPWPESTRAKAERLAAEQRLAEIEAAGRRLDDEARLDAAVRQYVHSEDPKLLATVTEFAGRGNTRAMVTLALMHQNGRGVTRDHAKAMTWLRKAAAEGEPLAMVQLGWIFETGTGEPAQHDLAALWYLKAARQGHAPGLFSLARMYESGRGGEGTNERKAYFLYAVAARRFNEQVEEGGRNENLTPYDRSGLGSAAAMLHLKKSLSRVDVSRMADLAAQWTAGMAFPD